MSVHLSVPVRSAAGVDIELPAKTVHLPFQVTVFALRCEPAAAPPQIQVAEAPPAEMCGVRDAAGRGEIRQGTDDDHEVFRRNREEEGQQDWPLREVQRKGEQNAEERGGGADGAR